MHIVRIPSPLGEMLVTADDDALTGLWFMDEQAYFPNFSAEDLAQVPLLDAAQDTAGIHPLLRAAARELAAYFAGDLREFTLPLSFKGTAFQRSVWMLLPKIPYGETLTYGSIADMTGHPGSARAVGGAVGRNPISIINPCHRVIGSSGALTGFGGGLWRKEFLLKLEGVLS